VAPYKAQTGEVIKMKMFKMTVLVVGVVAWGICTWTFAATQLMPYFQSWFKAFAETAFLPATGFAIGWVLSQEVSARLKKSVYAGVGIVWLILVFGFSWVTLGTPLNPHWVFVTGVLLLLICEGIFSAVFCDEAMKKKNEKKTIILPPDDHDPSLN